MTDTPTPIDGGAAFEDFEPDDDGCFMCGGSGYLEDECVCQSVVDICCCAEPEPRECPECRRQRLLTARVSTKSESGGTNA